MELIIVGASGLVGTEFIKLLENSELNFKKIYCIGSEKCLVHRGNICCITGMPGCGVNNIICNQCKA